MVIRAQQAILRWVNIAFTLSVLISSKKSDTCTLPPARAWLANRRRGTISTKHHIDEIDMTAGMTRNPMRRLGTTIAALCATNAWSFERPSDRRIVRVETGCLSHQQQSGLYPSKSD